ncbi:DNA polymerase III subunit gamma and tau [Micromonospora sp. DR5-3]|uniref:DNA polymerase III subunit gamma and tau n=1 Tax=unclassified Micromonospora TaxID=2617518 RepID=UPI0011D4A635|nr:MULTISPECIES: DNA polymerase III subunit gamma and tau [unclassified Micromonospora]MCW3813204.1 DNA polymerase III subunit gamma and tau [Micromonospora sp. DR5-3]TYC25821.1 DNA polymerase III subunit gamma and tau [Micromonospora sp. MP36]
MALALYRKYRPRTFAEVIGQEHVTEPLSQALRSGRLNHAYLFSGPRGCGKTSSARILARSLNCEQGPTPEPCGQCESCRSLATDGAGSIDVIEIDAASHGGVDDARELREKAFFAPARSRFKIYVIDEAHMVSSAGFNALLKLVEEPPEYVKFIFATTEPEKVLGTIKSRTHHYPFRLIPPKVLRPYLEQLTEAEGVKVEPAVFPLVVRAGGGSARDSLSVLDQLIAGAGPEGVSYARAAALLGVTDSALIDEMCDALAAGDGAAAYATVDRVAEAGHDPRRFASDLLERLRDLIVMQQVPDAAAKGLIDGPSDQIERMAAQAQRLGQATLSRCADIVHNGLVEMRGTTAPRLLLELICARMLLPGVDDSTGGLLQRLERMERRLTLGGAELPSAAAGPAPVAPAPEVRPEPPAPAAAAAALDPETAGTPAAAGAPSGVAAARAAAAAAGTRSATTPGVTDPAAGTPPTPAVGPVSGSPARRPAPASAVMSDPATPEPPRPGSAPAGALDAVAVRRVWPEVVGKVNRTNKRIAALMRDAVVRELDGDTLVLTVKSTVLARMMADHAAVLTDALYEELGGRWQIRCEVAGERGAASLGGPARPAAPTRPAPAGQPDASTGPAGAHGSRSGGSAGSGGGSAGRPAGPGGASSGGVRSDAGGAAIAAGARNGTGASPAGAAREAGGGRGGAAEAAGDDEDWPEPAQPGGAEEDWPEAARPGGAATATGADDWPEPARPGGATTTGTAAPAVPKPAGPPPTPPQPAAGAAGGAPASSAVAAARAAAAGGAPVSSAIAAARAAAAAAASGGPGKGARTAQPKTADADWAGEPPYDPDYDGPVAGRAAAAAPAYEGFDPGDEPLDDVIDERTARQSSEEQAVQLLREAFGAEKIDEVDAR